MKRAKRIIMSRRYTTRFNIVIALCFIGSFLWAYSDYQIKLKTHPNLPLIGMFFKVKAEPSWSYSTPFGK